MGARSTRPDDIERVRRQLEQWRRRRNRGIVYVPPAHLRLRCGREQKASSTRVPLVPTRGLFVCGVLTALCGPNARRFDRQTEAFQQRYRTVAVRGG